MNIQVFYNYQLANMNIQVLYNYQLANMNIQVLYNYQLANEQKIDIDDDVNEDDQF